MRHGPSPGTGTSPTCSSTHALRTRPHRNASAEDVNVFLVIECTRRSVGSAGNVVSALRVLLRFFYVRGYTATPLADCVPKAAAWRDSGRSRSLNAREVSRLLASCDRRTSAGRRDFAVLTVLVRLGLRAKEVATLSLADLDWHAGVVTVAGKGGRTDRLPLPADVGSRGGLLPVRSTPQRASGSLPPGAGAICDPDLGHGQPSRRPGPPQGWYLAGRGAPAAPYKRLGDAAGRCPAL